MIREGIEDYMRYRADKGKSIFKPVDLFVNLNCYFIETNSQKVTVLRDGSFKDMRSD